MIKRLLLKKRSNLRSPSANDFACPQEGRKFCAWPQRLDQMLALGPANFIMPRLWGLVKQLSSYAESTIF